MVKIKKQKVSFRKKKHFLRRPPGRIKNIIKFLIGGVLVGAIGFGLLQIKYMFVDSEYFMVKEADIKVYDWEGSLKKLSLNEIIDDEKILGTNIFFVDLNTLKEKIESTHTEFKHVVVRRFLPNKLIVQVELRKSIAQIRSDRYYFVDEEGVLLPDVKNFPDPDLPVIIGIGVNLAKAQTSKISSFKREKLTKALTVIREIEAIEKLSEYKLSMVDITDPGSLSFFFDRINVEIKIGNSDFRNRLEALVTVFEQLRPDINKFRYIDLRFEDPIVSPR